MPSGRRAASITNRLVIECAFICPSAAVASAVRTGSQRCGYGLSFHRSLDGGRGTRRRGTISEITGEGGRLADVLVWYVNEDRQGASHPRRVWLEMTRIAGDSALYICAVDVVRYGCVPRGSVIPARYARPPNV